LVGIFREFFGSTAADNHSIRTNFILPVPQHPQAPFPVYLSALHRYFPGFVILACDGDSRYGSNRLVLHAYTIKLTAPQDQSTHTPIF
jgi:hypothetical protein